MQVLEQPSDGVVAHLVALLREGLGEMTGAFAGPKQRRLRIPRVDASNKACKALRRPGSSPSLVAPPRPPDGAVALGIRVLFGI